MTDDKPRQRGGQPRSGDVLDMADCWLKARVTRGELERAKERARRAGAESLSDYVRRRVLDDDDPIAK